MNTSAANINRFGSAEQLAVALADAVASALDAGIRGRGSAALAVSGGSTPRRFFDVLATRGIDWPKVTVTLVDERCVPATSDRSNEKLVRDHLMTGPASRAAFAGLYRNAPAPDGHLDEIAANLPEHLDIVILGMGADGHTASFFPGGDNLARATNPDNPRLVTSMRAAGAGEPRVTMTLSKLLGANSLYLHIEGEEKWRVLENALNEGPLDDAPVRAVLHQDVRPLNIYWAP